VKVFLTILDSTRVLWTIVMAKIHGIKFATITNNKINIHFLISGQMGEGGPRPMQIMSITKFR